MTNAIYKYKVDPWEQGVLMPKGARILTVHEQQGDIYLWVGVDTDGPLEIRTIVVYGTGTTVANPEKLNYIGTAFLDGGTLVLHVFEAIK
jgi:hypothetical protein